MNALVTGGGGFLGQAIVRALRARGDSVRSLSRQDYPALRDIGVEQVRGDVANAAAVSAAARGCDIVFHVAAKAGIWGAYADYHRANVLGTENVIAACRQHGIRRLVHTSSPSVVFSGQDMEGVDESVPYPAHFEAHYPHTKALAEQLVLKANSPTLATVALRPHLIWGPGDNHLLPRLIARAKAGQLRRIGTQPKRVDTVFIENAADAHLLAADVLAPGATCAGRAYFIANGEPIPLWDMVNRMLAAAGLPPVTRSVPVPVAMALAWGFESVSRVTGSEREPRLTRFVVREMSTAHWFDISAAKRDFGYVPRVSTEEGLRRLADHLRTAGGRTTNLH
jgi:nucleoside-diphosphate-sugar epimerase